MSKNGENIFGVTPAMLTISPLTGSMWYLDQLFYVFK